MRNTKISNPYMNLDADTRSDDSLLRSIAEADKALEALAALKAFDDTDLNADLDLLEEERILASNEVACTDSLEFQSEDWTKLTHSKVAIPEGCHEVQAW